MHNSHGEIYSDLLSRLRTGCARGTMSTLTYAATPVDLNGNDQDDDAGWCYFLEQQSGSGWAVKNLQGLDLPESTFRQALRKMRPPSIEHLLAADTEPALPVASSCETAFRESLRKLRPPVLDRMLSVEYKRAEPDPVRGWETFPRRKRSEEGRWRRGRPRKLDLDQAMTISVNPSMLLLEAISESLRSYQAAPTSGSSSRNSPSPESDSVSYYCPVLPQFFEDGYSSRIPSNIKELQTELKAIQDECFTLKMSLHFMEEDNKKHNQCPEAITKENVKLKVEVVRLKDTISKKDQLLLSALEVLQNSDHPDATVREMEWQEEKKELERRMTDMEQLWSSRVTELEHKLELMSADASVGCQSTSLSEQKLSPVDAETLASLNLQESQQLIVVLTDELGSIKSQMEATSKEYNIAMKSMEQELNSVHKAVTEKDQKIQQLLKERTLLLQDTHAKVANLIDLCRTKDAEIDKLKSAASTATDDTISHSLKNANAEVVQLREEAEKKREEIETLQSELSEAREQKRRIVEEAEIMDLQQQELSERLETFASELRTLKKEKLELTAQLAATETKCATNSDRSGNSSSTPTPTKSVPKRAASLGPTNGRTELTKEVEKLRRECGEKDRRLKEALKEMKHLREKQKAWEDQPLAEGKSKVVTTKSAVKPLCELKKHRRSSCPSGGTRSQSSNRTNSAEDISGLSNNFSFLKHCAVVEKDFEKLSINELRELVLRSEALCWSMRSHLEDMADFFSALLLNGDLHRFQSSLTSKEVHKLKILMDRTADITLSASNFYDSTQAQLLSDSSISPVDDRLSGLDNSEPENQSRDRDLSFISVNSHIKEMKDFGSTSETDIVPVFGSSCDEQSGRNHRPRPSSGDRSHFNSLNSSLVQGLLEVLRRTERSVQKLCASLETFGQSHLFKLLVDEILDKLRSENLLLGSMPGQEWEEVSQELEAFNRRSQDVIQATNHVRRYLNDGLEHLRKISNSFATSSPSTKHPQTHGTTSQEQHKPQPELSVISIQPQHQEADIITDEAWTKTVVNTHCHLARSLEDFTKRLGEIVGDCMSEGGDQRFTGLVELEQPLKEMLNAFSVGEMDNESASWYRKELEMLPTAVPLIQQVSQITFSVLLENLTDRESQLKEAGDRIQNYEKNQESRLKEIRQVQDWNLRLQAEHKAKESLVKSLKSREEELIKKLAVQEEEVGKLGQVWKESSKKAVQMVKEQMESVMVTLKSVQEQVRNKDEEIEQLSKEVESERKTSQKLTSDLNCALLKHKTAQDKIEQLEDEVKRLEKESRENVKQLKCKSESVTSEMKRKDAEIETLSKELNELLENEKRSGEVLRGEMNSLRGEVRIKEDEILRLEQLMKELTDSSERDKTSAQLLRSEMDSVLSVLHGKDAEIARLSGLMKKMAEVSDNERRCALELKTELGSIRDKMESKDSEIARISALLEQVTLVSDSDRKATESMKAELVSTLASLELAQQKEKSMSELMQKAINAKAEVDASAQSLRTEVQKQVTEQFESELKNAKVRLETAILRCKKEEKVCADLRQELALSKTKLECVKTKWTQKVEAERQERLHAETELVKARKMNVVESELCQKLSNQVEQLDKELTKCRLEIQSNLKELETTRRDMKTAEEDRERLYRSKEEIEMVRSESMQAKVRCKVVEEELTRVRTLMGEELSQVEKKWRDRLACLERDAAKLRSDMTESRQENERLLSMIANYEEQIGAVSQMNAAPAHISEVIQAEAPSDLLGEMRQLKQEVQLNNDSNARLYRELKHHIHPAHKSHCPLAAAAQKHAPQTEQPRRSVSSSPDSGTVEETRQAMIRHIKSDSSSGTGSGKTLTLLTASTNSSSNPCTSCEDIPCTVIARPTHGYIKSPARKNVVGSPLSVNRTAKSPLHSRPSPRNLRINVDRSRTSLSPADRSSSSSSDGSSLHGRVLRQLGEEGHHWQNELDSTPTRDGPSDDVANSLIQYEGPLIVMMTSQNNQDDNTGNGDAKEDLLQRSNYSSPDLGIESDPNLGSSRSSSTSSSSTFHTTQPAWLHPRKEDDQSQGATQLLKSPLLTESLRNSNLNESGRSPLPSSDNNNCVELGLHGMCHLRDLELLRQELEEALVTFQGLRAAVRARLDSTKIASPAKSLEYSTLREVDSRCQQLTEYLLRSKRLLDKFWTQSLSPLQSPTDLVNKTLESPNQLVVSSCEPGILVVEEVLFLQNKLRKLEEKYKKTVVLLKAQKDRDRMVNRALEKQLSNTTKVIKLAKGNLKQSAGNEVRSVEKAKATANKSA